ncbi:phage integrase [Serratia ureilytica]|uniref:phage integrase n=1 Tax=Serratia ureilytica TaxID=300181 RepID=UPI0034C65B54
MTITKQDNGQYLVDVRPQGRKGKRIRKRFDTKGEAQKFERWIIATQNSKDWIEKPPDRRPLTELIEIWWKHYGCTQKSGENNLNELLNIASDLGSPRADQISIAAFSNYRAERLEAGLKIGSINRRHMMLSGVFTRLIKLGHFHNPHPLKGLAKLKDNIPEMAWLDKPRIAIFLEHLTGDNLKVVKLCLATGARWGEAADLTRDAVIKFKCTFTDTKNGKDRTVPISEEIHAMITEGDGRQLFPDVNYNTVRNLLKTLFPDLPDGQATHVMRHSFASHFMMNGGNILTLQKILGHATINQTMVYAHFAPDYLNDAVRLNPLETLHG